jgi:RNA polymerase sigma-70 factor (ECF subfamily)
MNSHSLSVPNQSFPKSGLVSQSSNEKPILIPSDDELMTLVRNRDQDAFGQLFDRYYITVRSVARKVLRNREDVADIVQEAFMDVYENASTFDPAKGSLKTWISYLTYHRSLRRLRLLKRQDWNASDSEDVSNVLDARTMPEHFIRSLDFRKSLETVLASLSEKQRRTMMLYFFEGWELPAIAADLEESWGNIRHLLYRGLAKLRAELVQNELLEGYVEFKQDKSSDKVKR